MKKNIAFVALFSLTTLASNNSTSEANYIKALVGSPKSYFSKYIVPASIITATILALDYTGNL